MELWQVIVGWIALGLLGAFIHSRFEREVSSPSAAVLLWLILWPFALVAVPVFLIGWLCFLVSKLFGWEKRELEDWEYY